MQNKKYYIFIIILTIVLIVSGCTTSNKSTDPKSMEPVTSQATTSEPVAKETLDNSGKDATISEVAEATIKETSIKYEDLIAEEKVIYNEIKNAIQNNEQYLIGFSKNSLQGIIKYDFNSDGKIDELKYYTNSDESTMSTKKIKIQINDSYVEEYTDDGKVAGGISYLGIIDADKTDKFVDIVIIKGELSDRVQNIFYRFPGDKITQIGTMNGSMLHYSGDGKIFFWGGSLYDPGYLDSFDKNLVLIYYDIKTNKTYPTNQIVGKTFTADRNIILYKTREDVVSGAPIEEEAILKFYKDNIIRKMEPGEKFTVLNIDGVIRKDEYEGSVNYFNNDDGVEIKTQNGEIGWIGGFHMIWD